MAFSRVIAVLTICFVCQTIAAPYSKPDGTETKDAVTSDYERTKRQLTSYTRHHPIQDWPLNYYLDNYQREQMTANAPVPKWLALAEIIPSGSPVALTDIPNSASTVTTFPQETKSTSHQRSKRKSDYYSGYQPYQEWSERLRAEEAKNPPTPEERADAENTAKKAGIGLIAGAVGGFITGGPPGALTGALIGTGMGAFSDKIANNLMNKTLPAIYSRYREPMWEMP